MDEGNSAPAVPTHAELERAIASVPGVISASVDRSAAGRSRLRIRLAPGEDAEAVSWAVAATLRERFGIALDPEDIRPRAVDDGDEADLDDHEADAGQAPMADPGDDQVRLITSQPGEVAEPRDDVLSASTLDTPHGLETGGSGEVTGIDREVELVETRQRLTAAAREALERMHERSGRAQVEELWHRPPAAGDVFDEDESDPDLEHEDAFEREPALEDEPVVDLPAAHDTPSPEAEPDVEARPEPSVAQAPQRAAILNLGTHREGPDVRVLATLEHAGRSAQGEASTLSSSRGIARAVAEATLDALRELTGPGFVAALDAVVLEPAGQGSTATVTVTLLTDRGEETLVGASVVRADPEQAIMRATLDAVNRRVDTLLSSAVAGAAG